MKKIYLLFAILFTFALNGMADIIVKGNVTDKATNEPLIGVNVSAKGSENNVVTDFNGNFEIVVPEGTTLEFSQIGYQTTTASAVQSMSIALGKGSKCTPHFTLEAGYNHSFSHGSIDMDFDGFEVGGLVDLDWTKGQSGKHIVGMQIGLLYSFGDYNYYLRNENAKESREKFYKSCQEQGYYNAKLSDHYYLHVLRSTVRFKYSYQFNEDWALNLYIGPECRGNLSWQEIVKMCYTESGDIHKEYTSFNYINGKYYYLISDNRSKTDEYSSTLSDEATINRLDYALGLGIGTRWKNLDLTFRYDIGLFNQLKNTEGQRFTRDALAITIGYRIL